MLSADENGRNCPAVSASADVMTTRCRFAPDGIELHSHPISVVNLPG